MGLRRTGRTRDAVGGGTTEDVAMIENFNKTFFTKFVFFF
jgi:hypothetical protein